MRFRVFRYAFSFFWDPVWDWGRWKTSYGWMVCLGPLTIILEV